MRNRDSDAPEAGRVMLFMLLIGALLSAAPASSQVLQLSHRMTISGWDSDIGRIDALIADRNGDVFVLDGLAQDIVVVSRSGSVIRRIGRRGDGPGEFATLTAIGWLGDTLVTLDAQQRRVSLWTPEGSLVEARGWPSAAGWPSGLMGAGGTLFGVGHESRPSVQIEPGIFQSPQPFLRYVDLAEGRASVIPIPKSDTLLSSRGFQCQGEGIIVGFDALFLARPLRAIGPNGTLATASQDALRLTLSEIRTGEVIQVLTRAHTPRRVTDKDWERAIRPVREQEREAGPLDCDIESMRPTFHPVIRSITSDELGRFWLEASSPDGYGVVLVNGDGSIAGRTVLPERDTRVPLYVRAGYLYLVSIDDYDVQSIQVYRIDGW